MTTDNSCNSDAILMIAYGSPERMEDVMPYLKLVTQGRVPEQRLKQVASHYELFGGKSPLNEWTYKQAAALEKQLAAQGNPTKVYVGMRYWHPFMADTLKQMASDGVKRATGVIMAAHQCDSSWNKYSQVVDQAKTETSVDIDVTYSPPPFDHPKFIQAAAQHVKESIDLLPPEHQDDAPILFTAHSIPYSDPQNELYVQQVTTSCKLVAESLRRDNWQLCYQSRSGRPTDPWLEPDVNDAVRDLAKQGATAAVIVPIGFVCDHIEVIYDLDTKVMATAKQAGITLQRAKTVNDNTLYIQALAQLASQVMQKEVN